MSQNRNRQPFARRGGNNKRNQNNIPRMLPSNASSRQGKPIAFSQPNNPGRITVSRMLYGTYDITNNGVADSLVAINFSLNDLPSYTEFTALFSTYCIEKIEIWFRPEYTVLSDAAAVSNSVNVDFYSAIDLIGSAAPGAVTDVMQYQNCAHTSITTTHYRKFKPAYLIDNQLPSCVPISTAAPSANWYGLLVGIPACGIEMTFRTTCKMTIALTGTK